MNNQKQVIKKHCLRMPENLKLNIDQWKLRWHNPTFERIKEDFTACIYCRLHQGSKYYWWADSYNIQPSFCCICEGLTFCQSFGKVVPILQGNNKNIFRQARVGSFCWTNKRPEMVNRRTILWYNSKPTVGNWILFGKLTIK